MTDDELYTSLTANTIVVLGTLCTMPRYDVSASWLYSKMAD